MAILFSVAPLLQAGQTSGIGVSAGWTAVAVVVRLVLFGAAIALFARFAEAPLTRMVGRLEPAPDRLISVVSVGLIVAAIGKLLGAGGGSLVALNLEARRCSVSA